MDRMKIARINELSRKQRTVGLSSDEASEQKKLRQEYLEAVRKNFRQTLENIKFKD